jgi:hypothetical protein
MTVTFIELGHAGRMGNCLFQVACTIGYSKKYNVPFCFPKWKYQDMFSIPQQYFIDKESISIDNTYQETRYTYSEIPFQENCSLSGYFQSTKYFDNCKEYVKDFLTPKEEYDLKDYCCIHVRRGDYFRYPLHHPVQPMQYYMDAVEKIGCNKFMVFSDDIEWCQDNFDDSVFTINECTSTESDFSKMVSCSNFIISNSSFSWWAAWLSKNENKKVITPNNWFGPKLKDTNPTYDLIPQDWLII